MMKSYIYHYITIAYTFNFMLVLKYLDIIDNHVFHLGGDIYPPTDDV